jgi:thymidylate synthase (FAD)
MNGIKIRSDIRVTLLRNQGSDLDIARAAWVAEPDDPRGYGDTEAVARIITFMMKGRHGTPFEHGSMTFHIEAPIFVFREWHRHRIGWSYNEVSARYRVMEPEFYCPSVTGGRPVVEPAGFKPLRPELATGTGNEGSFLFQESADSFMASWGTYQRLIARGIAREVARNVLPVATYSAMHATCNPRSLMAFLSLRTKDAAALVPSYPLWEIEQAARQMEAVFADLWPVTHAAFIANGRVAP